MRTPIGGSVRPAQCLSTPAPGICPIQSGRSVKSNEELDMLLAAAPVCNFAKYKVLPLAEMSDPDTVLQKLRN